MGSSHDCNALNERLFTLLSSHILCTSPGHLNLLQRTAGDIAFLIKYRYDSTFDPRTVDVLSFDEEDVLTKMGTMRYVFVVVHKDDHIKIEAQAWVLRANLIKSLQDTMAETLHQTVSTEVKAVCHPFQGFVLQGQTDKASGPLEYDSGGESEGTVGGGSGSGDGDEGTMDRDEDQVPHPNVSGKRLPGSDSTGFNS